MAVRTYPAAAVVADRMNLLQGQELQEAYHKLALVLEQEVVLLVLVLVLGVHPLAYLPWQVQVRQE